jgi:serine/threonine protein kinase
MGIEQVAPAPVFKDEKTEVSSRPGMWTIGFLIRTMTLSADMIYCLGPTKIRWMMGKLIGKGSYGRVYHAINLDVDPVEYIAVKQVEIPSTKSDLLNEQQRAAIEVLYHEISLLEGLDHENIVQYLGYDSDEAEGHLNIFLEYVAGGSVSSCLTKFGPFKEPLVSHITRQILQGLMYLHAKHILHRVSWFF